MGDGLERDRAWLELQQVNWLMKTSLSHRIEEEAGMTISEHEALWQLANHLDRRMTMSSLADRAMVTRSGATRMADRFERQGWVRREPSEDSRRVTNVVLTREGAAAVQQSVQTMARYRAELFDDRLSDGDVADLRRILGKLLRRLDLA